LATTSCTLVPHARIGRRRGRLRNGPCRIPSPPRPLSAPVGTGWRLALAWWRCTGWFQHRRANRLAQPSGRPRHLSMAIADGARALRHVYRRVDRAFRVDGDRLWRDVGRSTIAQSVVRGVCYTVGMKRRHAQHHVRLLGPLWLVLVVAVGWMPWGSKDRATSDPLPDQPSPSQLQPLRRRQTSSGVVPRQRSSTACNFDGPGRLLARAA
jgi:hypothetical protein